MRTTVTLDPEVEAMLRETVRERGIPFKRALNEAIRSGLARQTGVRKHRFTQKTFSMGAAQGFRWEKALAAADSLEDEEISRKLALRK